MNAQPKTLTNSQISNMAAMLESSSTPETLKIRFTSTSYEDGILSVNDVRIFA